MSTVTEADNGQVKTEQRKKTAVGKKAVAKAAERDGTFRATFPDTALLKKIVDSFKDISLEANFHLSADGINSQFMDSSHVSLCMLHLAREDFAAYTFQQDITVGVAFPTFTKILNCTRVLGSSEFTLQAMPGADKLNLSAVSTVNSERKLSYNMNLMTIDSECLDVPKLVYEWEINMAGEDYEFFGTVLKENLADTIVICVSEHEVELRAESSTDNTFMTLRLPCTGPAPQQASTAASSPPVATAEIDADAADAQPQQDDREEDDNEEEIAIRRTKKHKANKRRIREDDEEQEQPEPAVDAAKPAKKSAKSTKGVNELHIVHNKRGLLYGGRPRAPVTELRARFALSHMTTFGKATSVSRNSRVTLKLDPDQPIVVQFDLLERSSLCFYLAPKIEENGAEME